MRWFQVYQFLTMPLLLVALLLGSVSPTSAANSITITAPTNNASNLTCAYEVVVELKVDAGWNRETPRLKVFNNLGVLVATYELFLQAGTTETDKYTCLWNTLPLKNGYYQLVAETKFIKGNRPPQPPTVVPASSIVFASTLNGFNVDMDGAKTFAKVTSPAEGKEFSNQGETFTFNSDHKIIWRRHESCGTYLLPWRFRQVTTWSPDLTDKILEGEYRLPEEVEKDHGVNSTLAYTYTITAGMGNWTADAFSYGPGHRENIDTGRTNQLAHGVRNFRTAFPPPPPQ
jgi:hypothetical protein